MSSGRASFSLAAPPSSGKLSRKEKVSRTGRATSMDAGSAASPISGSESPSTPGSTSASGTYQPRPSVSHAQFPVIREDVPFGSLALPADSHARKSSAPPASADPFFSAAPGSGGADDLFSFFDPLAAPPTRPAAFSAPPKPMTQPAPRASAPAPAPFAATATAAADPFAAFDSFDPFASPAAAAPAPQPAASAAPVSPAADKSSKTKSAASPKKDDSSSSDDSSDSDSDDSDDSSDDEKPASVKRQQSDAKKASQAVKQLNRGHQSTAGASSAAGTGNKSLAVPGANGSAAVSSASSSSPGGATLLVDVLVMMHRGCPLLKYGKSGYPHFRQFQLSADNSHIVWFSGAKSLAQSQVALASIDEIRYGQATANFARHPAPDLAKSSFSLIYDHGRQTLDLIAKDPNEFLIWTRGLQELLRRIESDGPAQIENLKSLPLNLGINTARRSSVEIVDMNTGMTASAVGAQAHDEERPRAIASGNKHMFAEVSRNLANLKYKFGKRREELRDQVFLYSPQYSSMNLIVQRVAESVTKCSEFFQDGAYPECDDECWRAGVDLESLKSMMQAVRKQS